MTLLKSKLKEGLLLVLNLGSSSLKFTLIHSVSLNTAQSGSIISIGSKEVVMEIRSNEDQHVVKKIFTALDLDASIRELSDLLDENTRTKIIAIGYRIVQGGPQHINPERVSAKLLADLEAYLFLAPNHLPDEIKLMKAFRNAFIGIHHFACFDTYFHKDMPTNAKYYAVPEKYREMGLIRYGFHGLSYESIFQQLLEEDVDVKNKKIIIAHLGSGSSMVAIKNGTTQDTTMGISPMGGMVMSTRSGDLDPGAILFMLKQDKLSIDQLDEILSHESGLKAIAGTGDMQEILATRKSNQKAGEALDLFCYQAKKQIALLAAAMGGVDLLIFCGGIGEHAWLVREMICSDLQFMGISLDNRLNSGSGTLISLPESTVAVRVMKTDEQLMIAMHIQQLLSI